MRSLPIIDFCIWDAISLILPFAFALTLLDMKRMSATAKTDGDVLVMHVALHGLRTLLRLSLTALSVLYIIIVSPVYDIHFIVASAVYFCYNVVDMYQARYKSIKLDTWNIVHLRDAWIVFTVLAVTMRQKETPAWWWCVATVNLVAYLIICWGRSALLSP